MKLVIWLFRGLLFLLLLALAIKNSGAVTCASSLTSSGPCRCPWCCLGVFAAGAVLGLSARLASWRLLRPRAAPGRTSPPSSR